MAFVRQGIDSAMEVVSVSAFCTCYYSQILKSKIPHPVAYRGAGWGGSNPSPSEIPKDLQNRAKLSTRL